ncbi:response regulator [Pseudoduganella violacea]|uniref:Two-component system response regulator BasR n=1 Tax=Pseudoduganella violacea TaxID=1715466 RepID=A0A7W5BEN2_9BURK|nr:response regulator [Pseudoduganella violacea]MBB3121797.1 two-component system response regulator BasR [Pseudoduganella violacea]
MHILIIEDDLALGASLQQALKLEGISSEWLRQAGDIPCGSMEQRWDCVLLDLTLPDGSGLALLRDWRQRGHLIPVIIITAQAALSDRLTGLDSGADDFIVKPFATAELVSRLHAVLRRYAGQAHDVWTVGDLYLEPKGYHARLADTDLHLSPREFHLVLELAREPGVVIPKSVLAQRLEPLGDALDYGAIEVHVSNLRRKIGAQRIRTVRGVGYMLTI